MRKPFLALSLALFVLVGWAAAPPRTEAISCISVSDVSLLSPAGCDLGGLIFSNFSVSGSAGFSAATVGLGAFSNVTSSSVNLLFQLSTTPVPVDRTPPGGPGDVLLRYAVTAPAGIHLTGIAVTNDAIQNPVTIGEIACRVAFDATGTCSNADRLATLVVGVGDSLKAQFATSVDFAFLHKDIDVGVAGFITDFSNSHDFSPVPEPTTLVLFGSMFTGIGLAWRRRRQGSFK